MVTLYLWFNAAMLAGFGLWCGWKPQGTSRFLGFSLPGPAGLAEYIAVYGGLEFGLGLFYAIAATRPGLHAPALLMSACVYLAIAAFRAPVVLRHGRDTGFAAYALALELVLGVVALLLYARGTSA